MKTTSAIPGGEAFVNIARRIIVRALCAAVLLSGTGISAEVSPLILFAGVSARPVGNGTFEDIGLNQPLWSPTVMNRRQGGLRSAEWIR